MKYSLFGESTCAKIHVQTTEAGFVTQPREWSLGEFGRRVSSANVGVSAREPHLHDFRSSGRTRNPPPPQRRPPSRPCAHAALAHADRRKYGKQGSQCQGGPPATSILQPCPIHQ